MTFLEPLLLLGGLAVGAPLWLHLRRKFERRTTPFSTLRFFEVEESPKLGSLRLQDLLLLALRLAAVAAIVLAFAGPFFAGEATISTSRVHLVDATLSRQADRSSFDAEVQKISAALEATATGSQDAVIALATQPEVVVPFQAEPEEARAALAELAPTYERGSYLSAFRLAQSVLERSLGEERQLIVYADHQANQWDEDRQAAPFLETIDVQWGSAARVDALPNLSVGSPVVRRWHAGDESTLSLSAEVARRGDAEEAEVLLTVNGEPILERALKFAPGIDRYVVFAEWTETPSQAIERWTEGRIDVVAQGDPLPADDSAYFSFPPPRPEPIYLVAKSPYLDLALSPAVAETRWRRERLSPGEIDVDGTPLARAVVLEASYLQSARVREVVERHLTDGRGVVLFIDRLTPGAVDTLASWGLRATDPARGGATVELETIGFVVPLHPLFRPFREGDLGRLAEVEVTPTARLESTTASGLMFSRAGAGLLYEARPGGRLLVFPFAMTRRQTNWPVLGSFVPFLDQLLQYAGDTTGGSTHHRPRQFFRVPVPEGSGPLELVGQDGVAARFEAPASAVLDARAPERPGLYRLHDTVSKSTVAVVAVNPPTEESELDFVREPSVAAWRRTGVAARPEREAAVDRAAARSGAARWRGWLLLAAGLFLATEQLRLVARGPAA